MKKITFIIATLITISLYAQPILNASDINPLNISSNNFSASSSTLGVGVPGANVNWDFSSLVLTSLGTSSNVSVATAPYASSFPTANFFVRSSFDNRNSYGYYNLTTNKLEVTGLSDDNGVIFNFFNPDTIFIFPFSYNTSFTDTYQVDINSFVESKTVIYDAYGTVITPFGTYNNVIRLKQTSGLGSISYNWFKINPYTDILSANVNSNNNEINFRIYQPTNLATIQNQLNNKFSIFPNPTSGNISIKNASFSESETFVNVYDVLGNQIIKNEKVDNDLKNINISDFATGLYFIKIVDNNNSILYSDKIIKK